MWKLLYIKMLRVVCDIGRDIYIFVDSSNKILYLSHTNYLIHELELRTVCTLKHTIEDIWWRMWVKRSGTNLTLVYSMWWLNPAPKKKLKYIKHGLFLQNRVLENSDEHSSVFGGWDLFLRRSNLIWLVSTIGRFVRTRRAAWVYAGERWAAQSCAGVWQGETRGLK